MNETKVETCDLDEQTMTWCWAVDGGKIFIHFTTGLSELYDFRSKIDMMIKELEELQLEKNRKRKEEAEKLRLQRQGQPLSLRAQRARDIQGRGKNGTKET